MWNLKEELIKKIRIEIVVEQMIVKGQKSARIEDRKISSMINKHVANHIRRETKEELGKTKRRKYHN